MRAGEKLLIPAQTNTKLVCVQRQDDKAKAAIGPTVVVWEVEVNFESEAEELMYYLTPVTLNGKVNFDSTLPGLGRVEAVMQADWTIEHIDGRTWPSIDSFRKSLGAA